MPTPPLIASFKTALGEAGFWHRRAALAQCQSVRATPNGMVDDRRSGWTALPVAAVALQHLDLVAVRILHEEEPRHQAAVAVELLDVGGLQPERSEPPVLGVEVVDANATWP